MSLPSKQWTCCLGRLLLSDVTSAWCHPCSLQECPPDSPSGEKGGAGVANVLPFTHILGCNLLLTLACTLGLSRRLDTCAQPPAMTFFPGNWLSRTGNLSATSSARHLPHSKFSSNDSLVPLRDCMLSICEYGPRVCLLSWASTSCLQQLPAAWKSKNHGQGREA